MPEQHITSILSGNYATTGQFARGHAGVPHANVIWMAFLTTICGRWRSC